MHKFVIPAAMMVALAGSAPVALGDSSPIYAAAGSGSTSQVISRLQSEGYTIRKLKFDDGGYKVKAIDSTGHKRAFYVNP